MTGCRMNGRPGLALSLQQLLELPEVGGHGVPDTWHGDSPKQAARTTELELDRVRDPGSLWKGVQGIGEAGGERPELALKLQLWVSTMASFHLGMFSKSARNPNTSSIGLLIITVFSKLATNRSF
jgi:hypothetical protein